MQQIYSFLRTPLDGCFCLLIWNWRDFLVILVLVFVDWNDSPYACVILKSTKVLLMVTSKSLETTLGGSLASWKENTLKSGNFCDHMLELVQNTWEIRLQDWF